MSYINHFKVFLLFSGDVTMVMLLRWIACTDNELKWAIEI
jgi:hypothetical protein